MRYSLLTSALVASAVASPVLDIITKLVVDTDVVTVTAEAPTPSAPTETVVAAVPTTTDWVQVFKWSVTSSSTPPPPPPPAPTTPSTTVKPVVETPAPTSSPAPAPVEHKPKAKPQHHAAAGPEVAAGGTPSFNDIVVEHHNIHRRNHSAPDIAWDQGLADIAQQIGETCQYEHNVTAGGGGYGQNIAAGSPHGNISSVITDLFYNSEMMNFVPFYGQPTPSDMSDPVFDSFGHFTQVVWVGSTKVGCAVVNCAGAGNGPQGLGMVAADVQPFFTVCNYSPAGNFLGEFDKNVLKPKGDATVNWSYGGV